MESKEQETGSPYVQPAQGTFQQPVAYFVDQATGQMYYGVAPQQSQTLNPIQPPNPAQYVLYAAPQQPFQQAAAQQEPVSDQGSAQAAAQPDYSQVLKSVEDFAQGNATVSDVIKDFYAQTAQDDQFWKGAIVGAAAAVLLTSDSVRQAMAATFGSLFAGMAGAETADESGESAAHDDAQE